MKTIEQINKAGNINDKTSSVIKLFGTIITNGMEIRKATIGTQQVTKKQAATNDASVRNAPNPEIVCKYKNALCDVP